jgi:hypothetical protein
MIHTQHQEGPANLKMTETIEGLATSTDPIRMADLDFTNAPTVKGVGFRFIIPVPNLGAENVEHNIVDYKGRPETIVDYSFTNGTDQAQQAVVGDGTGVIIVGIDPEKVDREGAARAILDKVQELGGANALNKEKLDALIAFITDDLGIRDLYSSTDKTAREMVPQDGFTGDASERPLGLFEKNERAGPKAVFVDGAHSVLDGPHAGTAYYPDGFMAVQIPSSNPDGEPRYRSIAPSATAYCYALEDGTQITDPRSQLPVINV